MSRAICYLRVSTDEQVESGAGLAAQTDACRACAARLGAEIIAVKADDEGVSSVSDLDRRPALLEAISLLEKGDVLIVAKRDRLGRDPIIVAMIEASVRRAGARIVSAAGEGTESDGPTDILMRRIVDAFAEYERLIIKGRLKAALQAMKRRGERTGQIPFGKRVSCLCPRCNQPGRLIRILVKDENRQGIDCAGCGQVALDAVLLEPEPAELATVETILNLRATGVSCTGIAEELNRRGLSTKAGRRWHETTVRRVLARETVVPAPPNAVFQEN